MEIKYIIALGSALATFIAGFSCFLLLFRESTGKKSVFGRFNLVFIPFGIVSAVVFPLLYWLSPFSDDFIYGINFWSIAVPPLVALAVFGLPLLPKLQKWGWLINLLAVIVCTLLLPKEFLLCNGLLPFWADRLVIVIFWTLFSNFYYILNGLDGVLATENLTIGIGLTFLAVLGAAPYLFGIISLCFAVLCLTFMIFNWYPARLSLDNNGCRAVGFMLAWLIFINSAESSISCGIIFAMYYIVELLESAVKKLSLRDRYMKLTANTNYYQANISGLPPCNVIAFLFKLQVVLIIIGCFQIYAPNSFSIPILALIITVWFLTRLVDWQTPKKTLKQLNKDFVEDIKQNLDDFKNIGRDN